MTEVVALEDADVGALVGRVAAILDDGHLVVLPADSAYGVLANPFHPEGSARLYAARGASRDAPLPVLVPSAAPLAAFAEVSEAAQRLVAAFWPGPLTLLLKAEDSMAWDLGEAAGTVAVRMPREPLLRQVLAATGPLACTSAGQAGDEPPSTVAQARSSLGEEVTLYIDGGARTARRSTVVDVSRGGAEVRRLGGVSAAEVFTVARGAPADPGPEPEGPDQET